jgi:hypothetical protein
MYNPKTINDVLGFVEKIRETIKDSLEIVEKRMKSFSLGKEQNDQYGQGYGLKYNGKDIIWIGISPGLYEEENGMFVYAVAFVKRSLKENFKIDKCYIDDEWVYIPINKEIFVEEDKNQLLAEEVIKILKDIFIKNYLEK